MRLCYVTRALTGASTGDSFAMTPSTADVLREWLTRELLDQGTSRGYDEDLLDSIDSLGMVRLLDFVESRFNVSVPPQDVTVEQFGTLDAIAGYVDRART